MKLYFAGSITGGRGDAPLYAQLIDHLRTHGEILCEHVGDTSLKDSGENNLTAKNVHDRDMEWVLAADAIIAEVTTPSLGVGYEIGRAIENGKPVLCLYRERDGKTVSRMITGSQASSECYADVEEAKGIIDSFLGTL